FELAGDFTAVGEALPAGDDRGRLLGLLEEAVRRDIHFIARHPTALFQCLWNSGWWYDCPEAAAHYHLGLRLSGKQSRSVWRRLAFWLKSLVKPEDQPQARMLPWDPPGPKLSVLLQRWRAEKERVRPEFVWLR